MPRHSNFYDDEDLDDDYEYDEEGNGHESDDPVHQLVDFIVHGIDVESSNYILSIFPLIKKQEGEAFLIDLLERCDGDFEACVNELYEMAQKEEERKKKSAVNIVVKSNTKSSGNKNNSNKPSKTTQQPAASVPQNTNTQKKNDNKKQTNKKKDTKSNVIIVSELDNFTEISGTPTSEVSENIFTGMFSIV